MINSSIAAILGLALAIVLIIRKVSPVYSLILGALVGGILGCGSVVQTVNNMFDGVKSITPAVLRIVAAGVLSGALIKSGAAASISETIVRRLGPRFVFLSLSLAAMILCASGVFVAVAVITVAPVALALASRLGLSRGQVLISLIGGGKCGNIMSPNPNTIVAAENYDAPLSSVMAAGIIPALIGLFVTVYLIVPLLPSRDKVSASAVPGGDESGAELPSFAASIAGPLATILILALRPLLGIVIDPMIALPVGGLITLAATRSLRITAESLDYGLSKMAPVALLLVGTGTLAGVITASDMKDVVIGAVGQLQFEVFEYRLKNEYNSDIQMDRLDFSVARWVDTDDIESVKKTLDSRCMLVFDHFERPLILFANQFALNYYSERHEDVKLLEALDVNSTLG